MTERRLTTGGLLALVFLVGCPHPVPVHRPPTATNPLRIEAIPEPLYAGPLLTPRGEYLQIQYHLNLHNRGPRPLQIRRITLTALDARGQPLSRLELAPALLRRRLRPVGWIVMRDRQTIAAAHRFQGMLRRPKGDTLIAAGDGASLTDQLIIARPADAPRRIRCRVDHDAGFTMTEIPVRIYRQRTALRLPVAGRWWVMAGFRFDEYHGLGILSSQNFAYDLGVVGAELETCSGDPTRNDSYHASGRPILAAADGTVVALHDGVAENTLVGVRPAWQEILHRPQDLAGNHVVLKHTTGEYTAYMHMQPGLKVTLHQQVKQGQVVGRCGNSGNSLETHLHFQLQDGPDIMLANGLPARFGDFTYHLAHLKIYVPASQPMPLPLRLTVEPGRAEGAGPYREW